MNALCIFTFCKPQNLSKNDLRSCSENIVEHFKRHFTPHGGFTVRASTTLLFRTETYDFLIVSHY